MVHVGMQIQNLSACWENQDIDRQMKSLSGQKILRNGMISSTNQVKCLVHKKYFWIHTHKYFLQVSVES